MQKDTVNMGITDSFQALLADKVKMKRLLFMALGALVLYLILPLILQQMPQEIWSNGNMLLMLIVNQIFIGVVGWQANYFPKMGIYIPIIFIVLYAATEMLFFGQISWAMETNYLQTGYIVYFLRKLIKRSRDIQNKEQNKPFPKGVGRK